MNEAYEELEEKDLYDIIEDANEAMKLLNGPNGNVIKNASNRIVERAIFKFAKQTDPKDIAAVIELQLIIRKYKYGLFEEVQQLAQEGEEAQKELDNRNQTESDSVQET